MTDCISIFFEAWQIETSNERKDKLASAVSTTIEYDDPRTADTVIGLDALCDYVGMFTSNAPGWSARVVAQDSVKNYCRATVAFCGPGPNGVEITQHGQYFIETKDNTIIKMVGFAGFSMSDESV